MRSVRLGVVLASVAIGACAGEQKPPSAPSGPPPLERVIPGDAPAKDDGRLHHFRNYFALEQVGKEAHHFTAWWTDIEPSHCNATVVDGNVSLTGCMFGGMSVPPRSIPDVPDDVRAEAKLVESAVRAKSSNAQGLQIRYDGAYRELVLSEMIIVTSAQMMGSPVGWHGRVYLKADGALTRIEGLGTAWSHTSYGMADVPSTAARVDFTLPPSIDGQQLLTGAIIASGGVMNDAGARALAEHVLAVARDVASGKPVPTMAGLYASPVDTAVPATYDQPLALSLAIYARHKNFQEQKHADVVLRLHPRQAVREGKAAASAEVDLDGVHIKASATMSAFKPSTSPMRSSLDYGGRDMEATLVVHVEDDRGNVIDRSYPARGKVVGEPPAIATPAGLELPGTSSPSKEADALRWTWPGNGQASSFDFFLSPQLFAAPQR